MLEKSSFFNSVNGDRKYKANEFAEYFASFIGNGVFPNPATNLQVTANNDMTVTLKSGKAWINGYFYVNTDNLILRIEPADGVLNRIDRIVLRLDFLNREVRAVVKKCDFATNAVAKILQRDDDAHEIAIADIRVNHGAISITQADITDLRLNKDLCGIVHGTVFQVDPTAIFDQFQSWYSQTKQTYDTDIAKWSDDKKKAFDNWYLDNTTAFTQQFNTWYGDNTNKWTNDFTTWFNNIKGQLNGDIAANLDAKAVELENNIKTLNGVGEVKEKLNKSEFDNFKKDNESQMAETTTKVQTAQSTANSAMDKATQAFQYANNGKTLISNVVGSPLLATDTFQQQVDKIQAFKNIFATNLTNKGQGSVGTEELGNLINKVNNISTGKKWASGIIKNVGSTYIINGLAFKPNVVVAFKVADGNTNTKVNFYGFIASRSDEIGGSGQAGAATAISCLMYYKDTFVQKVMTDRVVWGEDGFSETIITDLGWLGETMTIKWYAYE